MKKINVRILSVVPFLLLLIALGACSSDTNDTNINETAIIPPEDTTAEIIKTETITAENTELFAANGVDGIVYSKLLDGSVDFAQKATVLTDESCEMDDNGITHCFNNILLENGQEIRVNTLHVMQKVPCLSPDEEIEISSFENGYVEITRIEL